MSKARTVYRSITIAVKTTVAYNCTLWLYNIRYHLQELQTRTRVDRIWCNVWKIARCHLLSVWCHWDGYVRIQQHSGTIEYLQWHGAEVRFTVPCSHTSHWAGTLQSQLQRLALCHTLQWARSGGCTWKDCSAYAHDIQCDCLLKLHTVCVSRR